MKKFLSCYLLIFSISFFQANAQVSDTSTVKFTSMLDSAYSEVEEINFSEAYQDQFGIYYAPDETQYQKFARLFIWASYYHSNGYSDSAFHLYEYLDENAPFSSYVAMRLADYYQELDDSNKVNYYLTRVVEKVSKNKGWFQAPYYSKRTDLKYMPRRVGFHDMTYAISVEYDFDRAFDKLVFLRQSLRDYFGLIDITNRKLELISEKHFAYNVIAAAYLNLGKFKSALLYAQKSLSLRKTADGNIFAGIAYLNLNNKQAGCIHLSRAAALGRNDAVFFIKENCR